MFLYKLILIILLNKTYAYITQEIETILLPTSNLTSAKEVREFYCIVFIAQCFKCYSRVIKSFFKLSSNLQISLTLKAFGKQIQLKLRKSDPIVSSTFKAWKRDATGELSQLNALTLCYYLHKDHISTAIINFCQEHEWVCETI